jgi:hypothetical protein
MNRSAVRSVRWREQLAVARIFAPIAWSAFLLPFGDAVVATGGVARSSRPGVALASYGVAYSLAVLSELPVLMILTTATALVVDRRSLALVRRFALVLGLLASMVDLFVAWGPGFDALMVPLMHLPPPIAGQAHLALRAVVPWPLCVSWRKCNQGVMIRSRRTRPLAVATTARTAGVAAGAIAGVVWLRLPGAVLGMTALMGGILIEACLVQVLVRPSVERLPAGPDDPARRLDLRRLARFHAPLVVPALPRLVTLSAVGAGIAHTPSPALSLAAWPIAYLAMTLLMGPLEGLLEPVIALDRDVEERRAARTFCLLLGIAASGFAALVALTPALGLYLSVLAIPGPLRGLVSGVFLLLSPVPALTAVRCWLRGRLAVARRTDDVQTATLLGAGVLLATLAAGTRLAVSPGARLGGAAFLAATAGEAVALAWLLGWRPRLARREAAGDRAPA